MKNACRLIVCITFLLVAGSVYADEICHVSRVTLSGLPRSMVGQILDAFQMNTGIGAAADVSCYEIQFVFATQLVIGNGTRDQVSVTRSFDGSFTYQPDSSDSRPIYISGLNLRQGDDLVLPTDPALGREKSFLNIIGTAGRRVILKDSILANVRQGIFADGDGAIDFDNVTITGDAAKSGACLSVEAPGATITGGEFKDCSNGIRVGANNVTIKDATIHNNKYGVYVEAGVSGMKIERTRIFGNVSGNNPTIPRLDGIFYADPIIRDFHFYDAVATSIVDVSALSESTHNYETRTPYVVLPEAPKAGSKVEFYDASSAGCNDQICEFLGSEEPQVINTEEFSQKNITNVPLPSAAKGKNIVAIYTHPELGSTVISKAFVVSARTPIVTFVAGPFEIPTSGVAQGGGNTGGGTDDDDVADDTTNSNDAGNSMSDGANPVDVTSLPESGGAQTFTGSGGGAAAVGAKCSLTTTGVTLHTMALGLDLWWLILAAIVVGSLRTVKVRIRKK